MKNIELYTEKHIKDITRKRDNEIKIGEEVTVILNSENWEEELKKSESIVIFLLKK